MNHLNNIFLKNKILKKGINCIKIIIIILIFTFFTTSCNIEIDKLEYQEITISGTKFSKKTKMIVDKITKTTNTYKAIVNSLIDSDYDKSKELIIYDISLVDEGNIVQPKEKVTVSIEIDYDEKYNYAIFHINDSNKVEELNCNIKDNKIYFSTSNFSYFVIAIKNSKINDKHNLKIELIPKIENCGNIEIYANNKLENYNYNYNYNYYYYKDENIELYAYAREGYKFCGWYEDENCLNLISQESYIYFKMPNNNLIIYAKFEK